MLWKVGDQEHQKNIDCARQSFFRSPTKSIHSAATHLQLPRSAVNKVVHKHLRLYTYKVQLLQAFQPNDKPIRKEFAFNMLE